MNTVMTGTISGTSPKILQVESSFVSGFAKLQVVGSVGDISRDGSERVRSALEQINQPVPPQRVIVSVTPADTQKEGNHFDLPVAVSLLKLMSKKAWTIELDEWLFAAELGLDGRLRRCRGIIALVTLARQKKLRGVVVSQHHLPELTLMQKLNPEQFGDLTILGCQDLGEVLNWLINGDEPKLADKTKMQLVRQNSVAPKRKTFADMFLTPDLVTLAGTIAIGRHSCLLRGSPGCGKTMFAERLPSILPTMTAEEHLEALAIQAAAMASVPASILAGYPPFKAPQHQASAAAILGADDRPGEMPLAHGGVLFLDELPEFRRDVIEALREPLENGSVQINRARHKQEWPTRVILIAAANNCPCGWFGSKRRKCGCGMARVRSYRDKLSGPILERIDLHVDIPENAKSAVGLLGQTAKNESTSEQLSDRVKQVAPAIEKRNKQFGVRFNRDLPPKCLLEACQLSQKSCDDLIAKLPGATALGHRGLVRLLRVARSLADWQGYAEVDERSVLPAWRWHAMGASHFRGDRFMGL